jgi:cobalt/nickel transport system ATP-binding protein
LDEPTNSLDEQSTQRLLEILRRLPQAMILVSHDGEFREKLTDQAFLLNQGHLEKVVNH